MSRRRRLAVVLLAGVLPWVVVAWPAGWYPIFSVGFLRLDTLAFTSLSAYVDRVGTVPNHLAAWPIATVLWAGGLLAAAFEDTSTVVVAGFLLLAGFQVGLLGLELSGQRGVLAVPVGALWLILAASWVVYDDARTPN